MTVKGKSYLTFGDDRPVEIHLDKPFDEAEAFKRGMKAITPYLLFLTAISTLGPLQFGFHLSELNAPEDVLTCKKATIQATSPPVLNIPQCIPMSTTMFGLVSSIYSIGGLIGALLGGPLAARKGRLTTMRLTSIFFIIGPLLEALALNIPMMASGRLISGIGAGAGIVVVPIYLSEVSPNYVRGFFGVLTQVMVNGGILLAQSLGVAFRNGHIWRVVLAIGAVIGLIQSVMLCFVVESPKWLYLHGHIMEGRETLEKIRGSSHVEQEIAEWGTQGVAPAEAEEEGLLSPSEHTSNKAPLGFLDLFRSPVYRPAIIIVIAVMSAQQFCGINSIVMYSVSILGSIIPQQADNISIIISAVNLVTTVLCMPLPDRLGRKTCLLLSIGGMGLGAALLATSIQVHIPILSAVAALLFVACFAVGLGPVPFLLASELVDERAIGSAQSAGLAANWLSTFAVAQFFPILNEALGGGYVYFIFAGIAVFFVVFIGFKLPETKGKTGMKEVWGVDPDEEL